MGAYEATKVVFARLQALEPNLAPKIIGMLLTKDNNEMDMIRLAHGPDNLLHSIIAKVRTDLTNKPSAPLASWGFMSSRGEEASFTVNKVGCDRDNKLNSAVTIREIASTGISAEAKHMVNSREEGKRIFVSKAATPNDACGFLERY
ncbi:hypothetical protein E2562_029310 [Oryza meyeriana var. granulata]|uniref:AtC3H46-like PABC-like domain-containing protein n=1 Tax=Oryza meyeriana var. granulata TaxID=110450 RepID=A0A6G1E4E9_9ORYZ|nr:hypothetical protein E2562_029310 [Oryza meyeriana var. granulata]